VAAAVEVEMVAVGRRLVSVLDEDEELDGPAMT